MKRVIVTGGAGFIGSHLVHRLSKLGVHSITIIDDLSRGKIKNLPFCHDGLEIVVGSISDESLMSYALRGADTLFHLAALSSVIGASVDGEGTLKTNVIGTIEVLTAARDWRQLELRINDN